MRYIPLKRAEFCVSGLLLLVMPLLLLSCGTVSGDVSNSTQQPRGTTNSSLDAEAVKEATKILEANFTKCGEYYFSYEYTKNVYYKNPESKPNTVQEVWQKMANVTPQSRPSTVTDADYRNDLRWKGDVWFSSTSVRKYVKNNGSENKDSLSKWGDGGLFFRLPMTKELTTGWKPGDYQRPALQRRIMGWRSDDWQYEPAAKEYRTNLAKHCSEEEQGKLLELDSREKLCTGRKCRTPELYCQEVGHKKVDCSQIPEPLKKER